jgi:hypothetical protein
MIRSAFPPLIAIALLAAVLFGVVIAWELADLGELSAATGPVPALAPRLPETSGGTPTPASDTAGRTRAWAATALARPLFSPDRRPASGTVATASGTTRGLPRLTGTLVGPFGRSAIFAADPKPVIVSEGDRINGYTIQSIEPNEVQMIGPEGIQVLHPSFQSAPARPTPPNPPPRLGQAALAR